MICKECKTELVKDDKGMKCPNWFNCSKHDIETNESIIKAQALYIKRLEVLVVDMARDAYHEANSMGCTWTEFERNIVDRALKEAGQ